MTRGGLNAPLTEEGFKQLCNDVGCAPRAQPAVIKSYTPHDNVYLHKACRDDIDRPISSNDRYSYVSWYVVTLLIFPVNAAA